MKRRSSLVFAGLLLGIGLWAFPLAAVTGTITTNGSTCTPSTNCLVLNLAPDKGGSILVLSGTWTTTIQFEATGDGGVTWAAVSVTPLNSTTAVTSTTANGVWQVNTAGFTGLRMRASASITGSAVATITFSAASARLNGGSSSGGSVSITATPPIVVTPSPLTGTGVASAPSLVAVGSVPACSAITTTEVMGQCYTTLTATQVVAATITPQTLIPALGSDVLVDVIDAIMEYKQGLLAFTCGTGAEYGLFYGDNGGTFEPASITVLCTNFLDGATGSPAIGFFAGTSAWEAVNVGSDQTIDVELPPTNTAVVFEAVAAVGATLGTGSTLTIFVSYRLITLI